MTCEYCRSYHAEEHCPSCGAPGVMPSVKPKAVPVIRPVLAPPTKKAIGAIDLVIMGTLWALGMAGVHVLNWIVNR